MNGGSDTPISDLPLPPDSLPRALRVECLALRSLLIKLEARWRSSSPSAPDSHASCFDEALDDACRTKLDEVESLRKLNQQIASKQYRAELSRLDSALEDNKRRLFHSVIEGQYDMYVTIIGHLRDLMGDDFDDFIAANDIDFPIVDSRKPERPLHPPGEIKFGYTHYDSEKQIRRIVSSAAENKSASAASSAESDASQDSSHA